MEINFSSIFCPGKKNVILFIGDGMGNEHVKAARYYNGGPLSFEGLPHQAQVTTHSANNSVTDSAASGTAIATGTKVNNYVVSLAIPGDGSELETSLEFHRKLGRRTGLVTTTFLTHATPATFGAHETDRNNYSQIGLDLVYRRLATGIYGTPLTAEMAETSYLDDTVENGTPYGYLVRAIDPDGNFSDSVEVPATPEAPVPPDYTAYVSQAPAGTYAALSGSHLSLAPGVSGAQSVTELKSGTGASLDAEYLLQTTARPFEVTSVTLHLSGSYADTNDPLIISLWTGSAWLDITAAMVNPTCAVPHGCVDANGQIRIRFTDSVSIRKETLGKLTLDELYAVITIGEPLPNQAPVAQDDTATTSAGTAVTIDLLANDSDPDGDVVTVTGVSQPANGTVTLIGGRNATYLPAGGFVGSDSFSYLLSDNRGGSASATVFLTINPAAAATVEVSGIALTPSLAGKNLKVTAAVRIVDQDGAPATGATVVGEWLFNGGPLASGTTAVTDSAGLAYLASPTVKASSGTFTFRVIDVQLPGHACTNTGDAVSVLVP